MGFYIWLVVLVFYPFQVAFVIIERKLSTLKLSSKLWGSRRLSPDESSRVKQAKEEPKRPF